MAFTEQISAACHAAQGRTGQPGQRGGRGSEGSMVEQARDWLLSLVSVGEEARAACLVLAPEGLGQVHGGF